MPIVLHVVPDDCALTAPGLEDWIDTVSAFMPLVAARETERWAAYGGFAPPPATSHWADRLPRWAVPSGWRQEPWRTVIASRQVAIVHLHTLDRAHELIPAADALGVPVVVSWPQGGPADFPFEAVDRVLVASPALGDHLLAAGCPPGVLRLAPPPLRLPSQSPRAWKPGEPIVWVSAGGASERDSLCLAIAAFARYCARHSDPTRLELWVPDALREALAAEAATQRVADRVSLQVPMSAEGLKVGLRRGQLAVFPLMNAHGLVGGLTASAWIAAASGLALVLGREAAHEGLRDQAEALLCEPTAEALASRMHFLAQRPHAWSTLARAASAYAHGRLSVERANEIPFEVYRQLLSGRRGVSPPAPAQPASWRARFSGSR